MLFFRLLSRLARQKGLREVITQVQLIDSTTISLCQSRYQWAHFRQNKSGVKIHTVYDPNADTPIYFEITDARVSDGRAISQLSVFKGTTYVFDRAYNGGAWLEKLVNEGCLFVGRMKKNMNYKVTKPLPPTGLGVVRDEKIEVCYKTLSTDLRACRSAVILPRVDEHRLTQRKAVNTSLQKPGKDKAILAGVQTICG